MGTVAVAHLDHVTHHLVSIEIADSRRHLELVCNIVGLVEKKLVVILGKIVGRRVFEDVFYCRLEVAFGKSRRGRKRERERERGEWQKYREERGEGEKHKERVKRERKEEKKRNKSRERERRGKKERIVVTIGAPLYCTGEK